LKARFQKAEAEKKIFIRPLRKEAFVKFG
jgi:hypothetical protein